MYYVEYETVAYELLKIIASNATLVDLEILQRGHLKELSKKTLEKMLAPKGRSN